jgi:hypothetical protein
MRSVPVSFADSTEMFFSSGAGMMCAFYLVGNIDGKGKAAFGPGVVEGRCEESAGLCESEALRVSGGKEASSYSRRGRAEGHEAWN